jgi:outer membrane biogenesis lipoprotein LolB
METQEAMNSQGNTQSKEQRWRYHDTRLQTILQSNNSKNSMVLAQKQTRKPVEQNRGPRYEDTQL